MDRAEVVFSEQIKIGTSYIECAINCHAYADIRVLGRRQVDRSDGKGRGLEVSDDIEGDIGLAIWHQRCLAKGRFAAICCK